MFQKFEIQGIHSDVDDRLKAYVAKKIGGLDRYVSRHSRESANCNVMLKTTKASDHNNCICEVALSLPKDKIVIHEKALNMYAAVDIVEQKLKQQLKKYKDLHDSGRLRRHLAARLKRA